MPTRDTTRNNQIATIKIAAKQLGMDDTTYRYMLSLVAGVHSAANLDAAGRKKVIDHLKSRGAKIGGDKTKGRPGTLDRNAQLQKIEALLADMQLPWAYADRIAENITGGKATGIKRLGWVRDGKHLQGVIAALTYEQEKRALLANVDELLKTVGKTRADVTAKIRSINGEQSNWERNKKLLRWLLDAIPLWWQEKAK